jgi:hypothetical protein
MIGDVYRIGAVVIYDGSGGTAVIGDGNALAVHVYRGAAITVGSRRRVSAGRLGVGWAAVVGCGIIGSVFYKCLRVVTFAASATRGGRYGRYKQKDTGHNEDGALTNK